MDSKVSFTRDREEMPNVQEPLRVNSKDQRMFYEVLKNPPLSLREASIVFTPNKKVAERGDYFAKDKKSSIVYNREQDMLQSMNLLNKSDETEDSFIKFPSKIEVELSSVFLDDVESINRAYENFVGVYGPKPSYIDELSGWYDVENANLLLQQNNQKNALEPASLYLDKNEGLSLSLKSAGLSDDQFKSAYLWYKGIAEIYGQDRDE
ncbi:MAG: hypothetical protein ABEI74_02685 [Candidatus Pacearchaeota archaeon]